MNRIVLGLLLPLIPVAGWSQTTNCYTDVGGSVRCFQSQGGPIPEETLDCNQMGPNTGTGALIRCSQPQKLSPPPQTITPTPWTQSITLPPVQNYLQQNQERLDMQNEWLQRAFSNLQQQQYQNQQLELEREQLELQEFNQYKSESTGAASASVPTTRPTTDSNKDGVNAQQFAPQTRKRILEANYCFGYIGALLDELEKGKDSPDRKKQVDDQIYNKWISEKIFKMAGLTMYLFGSSKIVDDETQNMLQEKGKNDYARLLKFANTPNTSCSSLSGLNHRKCVVDADSAEQRRIGADICNKLSFMYADSHGN